LLAGRNVAIAARGDTNARLQSGPGSISGVVKDESGAVIVAAVITVTESQTGASRWVTSDAEGRYMVSGLAPGSYFVKAQGTALLPVTTPAIAVEAGREQAVDFTLAPLR
jgi:hypothetical protein